MIKKNKFGQLVFTENDLVDQVMMGKDLNEFNGSLIEGSIDLTTVLPLLGNVPTFINYSDEIEKSLTIEKFDQQNQNTWLMPTEYQQLDIAKYILDLCQTDAELQRVGEELLLYQERNLFDLLRYLKYLVDVMKENRLIWGVGRGSSLASYVLFLLGIHRINSMYYDLDPREFLR